jgi:threonine dehydrogenase-like Zn-dependent dehydrogenase
VGERVALQEYLPCRSCTWCLRGHYRLCAEADFFGGARPRRIGLMDCSAPPHLTGAFAQYMHLPWNTVIHRIPQDLPAHIATLAIPLGNGVQWACLDGPSGAGKTVLVIGPGQQGLGCVLAAKAAGADCVIVSGLDRDRTRLALAPRLGADHVIHAEQEDLTTRVNAITHGAGVDVVIDTTGDPDGKLMDQYIQFAAKEAYLSVNCFDKGVPVSEIKKKCLTVRSPRGRTYQAVERALKYITSGRFPLDEMCSHRFALSEVDLAIKATAGREIEGAIHVVVEPWR